jgi:hypothetical protein
MEVAKLRKDWPEKHKRKRKWVNADKCEGYVKNAGLLSVINEGVRCVRSNGGHFRRAIETLRGDFKN